MSQNYDYGDYNRGGMWAFAFSMFVTLVFFVYIAFVHSGVDLKEVDQNQPKVKKPKNLSESEPGKTDPKNSK